MADYKPNEMMTIAAARSLKNDDVCFVGIGMPSAAANLARLTHAPNITLIYESGTLATKPDVLPLSIGDGELCETALTTVVGAGDVPLLAAGRPHQGRLPGRRADRQIRQSQHHRGRPLRQAEGAAAGRRRRAGDRHLAAARSSSSWRSRKRSFVDKLDFVTSIGHVTGGDSRAKLGVKTKGPTKLITDLALFAPDPETKEMTVVSIHPGVTREQIVENTGWPVKFAAKVAETPAPTAQELEVLRDLQARTARAHAAAA